MNICNVSIYKHYKAELIGNSFLEKHADLMEDTLSGKILGKKDILFLYLISRNSFQIKHDLEPETRKREEYDELIYAS